MIAMVHLRADALGTPARIEWASAALFASCLILGCSWVPTSQLATGLRNSRGR